MSSFICLHKGFAILSNCEELKAFSLSFFLPFLQSHSQMKARTKKRTSAVRLPHTGHSIIYSSGMMYLGLSQNNLQQPALVAIKEHVTPGNGVTDVVLIGFGLKEGGGKKSNMTKTNKPQYIRQRAS